MNVSIVTIFLCMALVTLVVIIALVLVHLYEIFEEPSIKKRMRRLRKPVQPWVTVLLYGRSGQGGIDQSLKALLRSNYHHFDIVIVDDASHDATKALAKGYDKSRKGEIVISLQAGTIVKPSFIKRAVATKGERRQITMRIYEPVRLESLTEIFQSLNNSLWRRVQKARVGDASNILLAKNATRVDFIITLFFVAIVSVGLAVNEPAILWYSWLIVTSYLIAAIWLREDGIKTKLKLTFSAFSALFILPVSSIIVRLSQFRTRN